MDNTLVNHAEDSSNNILPLGIIITLTIFSEDETFITFMATSYIEQTFKNLGYELDKITSGKHIDATRPHWHIMFKGNIAQSRTWKGLDSKIRRESKHLEFPSKACADIFREADYKISYLYQGEHKLHKKKVVVFGEEAMRYPFKEYTDFDQIDLEIQHGWTKPELRALWEQASQEWRIVKKKRNDQMIQQLKEKDEFEDLISYLKNNLKTYVEHTVCIGTLILHTETLIWTYKKDCYKKKQVKSIRVASVKDQAISFLVFNDYISPEQIVTHLST